MIRKISAAFTGGAIGSFVDSFNIWFMGKVGISDLIGLSMKPEFSAPWLCQRMVWGGIWMLLLLLPLLKKKVVLRGCLFSLLPSSMMLFMVLPEMGKGMLGLGFGIVTPLVVVGLNCIYGMVASLWYRKGTI
ncbi:hypothetical protein KI809_02205 [Geobacter pelophilus]|uniref:Uncharacterized protein n=1 Tax=Geoanaerobacter pelophilus TaxID=60036 RepID=A0AAW4L777_9BACT|nr:hypothetical protein [Geoanaerobacter pelophilus]MBT0663101.1 hypothetical protein [Geoanaerobacter pelophilus]